jgi:hypothetical protein
MQDLRVIGVENGALLVAGDDGERYRIAIDEVLQAKLRQAVPDPGVGRKLAPREIQAHIRSGMSAADVAAITGVSLEYIQRFEGPVLAEREFVVDTALKVPVYTALETDPLAQGATFGSVIRDRLYDLGAINERWASWKEEGAGWVVKLSFTANQIDHDARWRFDPKKMALDPMNGEAVTLSQQGDAAGPLIPRLRAVHSDDRDQDASRFDSGAFDIAVASAPDAATQYDSSPVRTSAPAVDEPAEMNQTADLLEALRRRRGEREVAAFDDEPAPGTPSPMHPSTGSIRIVDVPLTLLDEDDVSDSRKTAPQPTLSQTGSMSGTGQQPRAGRKGRQSMPSWDEIVFGARPDDDLA